MSLLKTYMQKRCVSIGILIYKKCVFKKYECSAAIMIMQTDYMFGVVQTEWSRFSFLMKIK